MNGCSNDAPGNLMRLHQPAWGIDGGACNDAPSNWRPINMSMATWISGEPPYVYIKHNPSGFPISGCDEPMGK